MIKSKMRGSYPIDSEKMTWRKDMTDAEKDLWKIQQEKHQQRAREKQGLYEHDFQDPEVIIEETMREIRKRK